uniref:Carrier domain-containing protein n=1 Tax=Brassica oleracea var. oleracea TaxID=109376 RepID=A0A0D3DMT3_BRAOL
MALEKKFDISVEETDAQNITTIQEAADLIEDLVQKKPAAQTVCYISFSGSYDWMRQLTEAVPL